MKQKVQQPASALTLTIVFYTTQSTYNAYISIPPSSIGFFPHFKPKAAQKSSLYIHTSKYDECLARQ